MISSEGKERRIIIRIRQSSGCLIKKTIIIWEVILIKRRRLKLKRKTWRSAVALVLAVQMAVASGVTAMAQTNMVA